jgi:hypothetical protein
MRAEDLLARAMADQDIDDQPGVGEWQVSREPIAASEHPEGEVMVGRSVRMPLGTYERIRAVAEARRMSVSRLIREWVDDGLERAEASDQGDPVVELHRSLDAAQRALQALEGHQDAA